MSSTSEEIIFGYKSDTGRIVQHRDKFVWNELMGRFEASITFTMVPGERMVKAGIVQYGRWFWDSYSYTAPKTIHRDKLGAIDEEWLPKMTINYSWSGFGPFSDPYTDAYQPPHGPDDPCTCTGCSSCDGFEVRCACDIDWEAMREVKEDAQYG